MNLIEFRRWRIACFSKGFCIRVGLLICVLSQCVGQSVVVESKISWALTTSSTLGNTCSLEVCEEWETPFFCEGENASPLRSCVCFTTITLVTQYDNPASILVWFQAWFKNRRSKYRNKQMEFLLSSDTTDPLNNFPPKKDEDPESASVAKESQQFLLCQ